MKKINVLVTGIGGGGHGDQIIKSLRLSNRFKLNIIGTDVTKYSTGKKIVDVFYKIPYASDKNYKDVIVDIMKKHNVKFAFHGSEPELKFMSENRNIFERLSVGHPLNSKAVIDLCMDKYKTFEYLTKHGFNVGRYKKINSFDDINSIDFFPLILKPNKNSGGSMNVNICFDRQDLINISQYLLKYKVELIAQEYIYADNEYTIGVSSDNASNILGSIALKRNLNNALSTKFQVVRNNKKYIISSGISQGKIIRSDNILRQAERISDSLKSIGPLNIQGRVIDGILYPFEINPRLSGTTYIRALSGYNEPELMVCNYVLNSGFSLNNYKQITVMRTVQEVIVG